DLTQAGPEQLRVFLESYPVALEQALGRIIPPDAALRAALELVNWGWVNNLVGGNDAILDKATAGVRSELEEFQKLEQAAASAGKYDEAIQYQRVQRQIQGRDLLGYLGTHNVLPKYGFPSDVVQLQTDHLPNISGAVDIELDRDLKIAIAEFAPGGQVVAAKRIWYSQGIRRMPDKKWPPYAYAICSQCKRMNIHIGENIPPVCICGQPLSGTKQKGIFIVPEHGFIASSKTDTPGEQPPERIYASRIHFSNYSYQDEQITGPNPEAQMEPDPAFSAMGQVFKGYSRYGWLAVVNDGYGQGFHVCSHCGYSDVIDPAAKKHKATAHKNPLTGKDCNGALERYDLGHRFMTDVLELRLSASIATEKQVLSLLYALLSGASDALDIQREDIDGVVYYRDDGPAFVLFDTTPGGSGHVKLVYDHLHTVFEAAYRRVSECNGCGPETSCYSCLRSYRNQFMHDKLERGLAWTILGTVLNKPLP
ncbi:MAG: DUF1998 domain-containing protein, partial [Anaerolineae bacterium]|nr:DUF1998 domain-containing protein [Anaerolineae bacterium]